LSAFVSLASVENDALSHANRHTAPPGDFVFSALRICAFMLFAGLIAQAAGAADLSLLPKFGSASKSQAERAADAKLLAAIDQQYGGDRKRAAQDAATRGWIALRARNLDEAMRRFNQAWLIDPNSGQALWGMGAVQGLAGKTPESLDLFREAEPLMGDDIDFAVDSALTSGRAAAQSKEPEKIQEALDRFARLHQRAPQHALNLQNWAIMLSELGSYEQAWEKIQLAQATPRAAHLDARFIAQLKQKLEGQQAGNAATSDSHGAPPQLWSDHKRLAIPEQVCADKAQRILVALGFVDVVRKDGNVYGNMDDSRAAVKCVPLERGSFVYFAVAGAQKVHVESLRNAIAHEF
jgi:tetratricopeptide (TPR) repeat protein